MYELVHIIGHSSLVISGLRPIGISKAMEVRRKYGVVLCQCGHRLAPSVRHFRETVQQNEGSPEPAMR